MKKNGGEALNFLIYIRIIFIQAFWANTMVDFSAPNGAGGTPPPLRPGVFPVYASPVLLTGVAGSATGAAGWGHISEA